MEEKIPWEDLMFSEQWGKMAEHDKFLAGTICTNGGEKRRRSQLNPGIQASEEMMIVSVGERERESMYECVCLCI